MSLLQPTSRAQLAAFDPAIASEIAAEEQRQQDTIDLIASENHTHPEVLATSGSVLTDKYSEGYPGRRYYAGQQRYDAIERLAIERARAVFSAEHVNVQPLSGSPMNQAVYFGLLNPGDTILAMDLSHGGHLTHGAPVSHMGKIFRFVRYKTLGEGGKIDFDSVRKLALEHRPKLVLCGHSSYPREIDYAKFKQIAVEIGALTMADVSHIGGLIAGGVLRNPLLDGFDVMTLTTHKTLRGPRGGLILCRSAHGKAIDQSVFPGLQGGPHMHSIAGVAVALKKAVSTEFRNYCQQVLRNAQALAGELTRLRASLITGGTDNHLLVVDVTRSYGIDGAVAQTRLEAAGIVCNKQIIPDDLAPPLRPSGIRLGSPASTTRGMQEPEMIQIAGWIDQLLRGRMYPADMAGEVKTFCQRFPIPTVSNSAGVQ